MSGCVTVLSFKLKPTLTRPYWLALAILASPMLQAAAVTSQTSSLSQIPEAAQSLTQTDSSLGGDLKNHGPLFSDPADAPAGAKDGAQTPTTAVPETEAGFGQDPKHVHSTQEASATPEEAEAASKEDGPLRFPPRDASGAQSFPYLQLNGQIEAGWMDVKPYGGSSKDEWIVSTLELMMTFQPHPWVTLQVSGLYEDNGQTPLEVDVSQLRIGPPEGTWFLNAGQFYLPFGRYESNMVSDPLTLELGENREVAAALGFEINHLFGTAYIFSGKQHPEEGRSLDEWGAEVGFSGQMGAHPLTLAVGYTSDIGDSDSLSEVKQDDQRIGGLAASALYEADPWTLMAEYVSATERFGRGAGEALWNQRPSAWMIEAGYRFHLIGKEALVALGYQGTADALALELPKTRRLITFNLGIFDYTTLQLEFVHDQDYCQDQGGSGDSGHGFTAQVAIAF